MIQNLSDSKRIYYLDIIRGLAVFFMVMQHCIIMFEHTGGEGEGIIGNIFLLLGTAPAAPMFMVIMGVFMMKSKVDNKTFLFRGLKLLAAGYILNFLRFTLPAIICGEATVGIRMLFGVDIFQLAGLFYIAVIPLRKIVDKHWFSPVFIVLVLIVSPYLWGITPENPITNLFWGTSGDVAFPFFPWCVYPLIGMYLSKYIAVPKMESKHRKFILTTTILLVGVGFATLKHFPYMDYSRYGLGASLLMIVFVLMYLLVAEIVTKRFHLSPEQKIIETLIYWSKNLTNIYLISWVIYGWSAPFIGYNEHTDIVSMLLGLAILIITHLLVKNTKISKLIPKI